MSDETRNDEVAVRYPEAARVRLRGVNGSSFQLTDELIFGVRAVDCRLALSPRRPADSELSHRPSVLQRYHNGRETANHAIGRPAVARIRWHFIIAERTRAAKTGALAIISRVGNNFLNVPQEGFHFLLPPGLRGRK